MVSSGKSLFLSAILGEISLTEGQVKINGDVSYASQEAWCLSSVPPSARIYSSDSLTSINDRR